MMRKGWVGERNENLRGNGEEMWMVTVVYCNNESGSVGWTLLYSDCDS